MLVIGRINFIRVSDLEMKPSHKNCRNATEDPIENSDYVTIFIYS